MPRPLSRSASWRFTRDSRHAGHSPNASAVTRREGDGEGQHGAVERDLVDARQIARAQATGSLECPA